MHANHITPDIDPTDNLQFAESTVENLDAVLFYGNPTKATDTGNNDNSGGIVLDHTTFNLAVHDGMVTIHNPTTGNHRTFRVRTQANGAKFAPGKRIVSLLTGPNREDPESWMSFGFVETDRNRDGGAYVRVWRKFEGKTEGWETFGRMLTSPRVWAAKGAEYLVEARCRRCGRPLTVPESVKTGLGPVCAGRE